MPVARNITVRKAIVDASRSGYTQSQIAARLGVSRQRIHAVLKQAKCDPSFLAERAGSSTRVQIIEWLEGRPDGLWAFPDLYGSIDNVGRNNDPDTKSKAIKKVLRSLGYQPRWVRPGLLGVALEPLPYEADIVPPFTEKPRKKAKPIPLEIICICPPKEETLGEQERAEITAMDYVGAAIADGRLPIQSREPEPELPDVDDAIGF